MSGSIRGGGGGGAPAPGGPPPLNPRNSGNFETEPAIANVSATNLKARNLKVSSAIWVTAKGISVSAKYPGISAKVKSKSL